MNYHDLFKFKLFGPDPDTLAAYRTSIPQSINLHVKSEGDFIMATITKINGERIIKDAHLVTEAKTQDELVYMVNDLIMTYKNIPPAYRKFYKTILTPDGHIPSDIALTKKNDLQLVKAG